MGWKYISKVRVFESDIDFPYIPFYVSEYAFCTGPVDKIVQELDNAVKATRRKRALSKVGTFKQRVPPGRRSKRGNAVS